MVQNYLGVVRDLYFLVGNVRVISICPNTSHYDRVSSRLGGLAVCWIETPPLWHATRHNKHRIQLFVTSVCKVLYR